MGRPKIEINERIVLGLAKILCTNEEIAAVVECHPDTLVDRFSDLLKKGREQGKASLRREQYRLAVKGNPTMLIWLGKNHLGQSDKVQVEDKTPAAKKHAEIIRDKRQARMAAEAKPTNAKPAQIAGAKPN